VLFIYSTNRTLGADHSTVYVRLAAADGLQKGDAVLYRGVKVGEVKAIDFAGRDVIVRTRLNRSVPLTRDASAEMVAADMFGRQTLVFEAGAGNGQPLMNGDTLAGVSPVTLTGRIEALGRQVDSFLSDSMIASVRALLDGANATSGSATSAFGRIESLARTADGILEDQRDVLDDLTREVVAVLHNLRTATDSAEIEALTSRLESTVDRIDTVVANVDAATSTLADLLTGLDSGRGTAGRLLTDDALFERAVGAIAALERLIDDVREHPKRYLTVEIF
jgi:phospholipid/cholesterol/gamma-HCH transport system substrate-binding protein